MIPNMQKRNIIIFGIIGGLIGFAIHLLRDHYLPGVTLFSMDYHALNGTVFTFIGIEIGIIVGAKASKESRGQN